MKILVIGPAWVGDMVIAQSLFKSLKLSFPESSIDVIAPDWTRALLNRMPEVNQALSLPFKHGEFNIVKRIQLGVSLRKNNYTHAYVLPNSWKSALIPFFANIPHRIGFRGEMRWGLLNHVITLDKQKLPLMMDRFLALNLKPTATNDKKLFLPRLNIEHQNTQIITHKFNLTLSPHQKIIALSPGAEFGSSKRWPEKYYADIAQYFIDKNCPVWLMGSQKDKTVTQTINALTQNKCQDFAGLTTLDEAIDLISFTQLVITNDSGLMHIAAALDKHIIAIYGSTSPGFTPPLSEKAQSLFIDPKDLTCRPCFQRECPLGHHKCMNDLTPEIVLKAIEKCVY
jgi:heptosyltransferase-2